MIDLPIMRRCGLAIAVANARPQVKAMAHHRTPSVGGHGAARDAVEYILAAQGTLEKVIDAYIHARTSIQGAVTFDFGRENSESDQCGTMTNPNKSRFEYFFFNFLLAISLVTAPILSHAQAGGEPVAIGKKFEIRSKVLNETRSLLISTPEGYDQETDRYPVLYVLDGDENFVQAVGIVRSLADSDRIPPMLVVGIGNTERTRDLTPPTEVENENRFFPKNGGADAFLQFFGGELIPYVDTHYRTRPYKVLVGHSAGGLFAIYALASSPTLFNAYIAIDPMLSWNNQAAVTKLETVFKDTKELASDLYITATDEGGPALGADYKLCGILNRRTPKEFRWTFKQMPGETHTLNPSSGHLFRARPHF